VDQQARQRVLCVCAAVILLFGLTDRMVLGRFTVEAVGLRVFWASLCLLTAALLPRLSVLQRSPLFIVLGALSSICFAGSAYLTGGAQSPLFHWILAMPLVMAVVLQEYPVATGAAALATLVCGVAILLGAGSDVAYTVQWLIQASGMSGLAIYASVTYWKMFQRQLSLEAERRSAQANAQSFAEEVQVRDEFLSMASHELRTLLTSLELYVQTLKKSASSSLELRNKTDAIDRQAKRLNRLIEELLDVTRIRFQKLSLKLEPVDAALVARACVQRLWADAERAGSTVSLHAPTTVVGVWDPLRLDQILTNLLSNALKYGNGKPIDLWVRGTPAGCEIQVTDQGIGIAAKEQETIFRRFGRAVPAHNYGGLGLGLYIVRELVEALGGTVRVESNEGQGASFFVFLPYAVPERAPATAPLAIRP